jgi:hypothetical protein
VQTEVAQLKKIFRYFSAYSLEKNPSLTNARLDQVQPLLDLYQKIYADLVVGASTPQNDNAAQPACNQRWSYINRSILTTLIPEESAQPQNSEV